MNVLGLVNYWAFIFLMMVGFYILISQGNLIKKIVGLSVFQTSVFILYISMVKIRGGTAPILMEGDPVYSNPLPHVLILTAIVVGVATTALGLSLVAVAGSPGASRSRRAGRRSGSPFSFSGEFRPRGRSATPSADGRPPSGSSTGSISSARSSWSS